MGRIDRRWWQCTPLAPKSAKDGQGSTDATARLGQREIELAPTDEDLQGGARSCGERREHARAIFGRKTGDGSRGKCGPVLNSNSGNGGLGVLRCGAAHPLGLGTRSKAPRAASRSSAAPAWIPAPDFVAVLESPSSRLNLRRVALA